jgi:hypothetical protein
MILVSQFVTASGAVASNGSAYVIGGAAWQVGWLLVPKNLTAPTDVLSPVTSVVKPLIEAACGIREPPGFTLRGLHGSSQSRFQVRTMTERSIQQ